MQSRLVALAVATVAFGVQAFAVTPVQKVIQMMEEMKAKAVKEKNDEIVEFTKFQEYCTHNEKEKASAIEDGKADIEQYTADIKKNNADAAVLAEEIAKLDESIALAEQDKAESTAIREKEHADFSAALAEYVESIGDLDSATQKIKTMMSSVKSASAASLLQMFAEDKDMSVRAKSTITAFLSVSEESELGAPAGPVYQSQAGGVVGLMKDLMKKLKSEKDTLEKEEMKKQSSYDMLMQSLVGQITEQTESRDTKTSTKKQKETASAQATGDLGMTEAALGTDTEFLAELKKTCGQKAKDFESRQKLRAEELVAVNKAIEIVSSPTVSGAAGKHLPGLVQTSGNVLAQLRSGNTVNQPFQSRVSSFLRSQGDRLGSNVLSALAMRVSEDPLAKVKKMIEDMVYKLMEEANEEAGHKAFCDAEMGTNKHTRDAKSSAVEELAASIQEMSAEIAQITEKAADISDQVTEIDAAVGKATAERNEEKEKNQVTIDDAKAAKTAVESALKILKDFYDKASQATALVQEDTSEESDKPFQGSGGGGIIGMLEVILSDFERLLEETTTNESTAAEQYTTLMRDSKREKAVKNQELKHLESEKVRISSDLADAKKDLKSTQKELDAALAYFEKLKPSCVVAGETYEERVAKRNEEIESLKDALQILSGEA